MNDENGTRGTAAIFGGAATLGLAAIISKLIGTLQKIPLQNMAGDETFGIYNVVFPFYTLTLFIATAGFPVAISKFVSDYLAVGDEHTAKRVLRISMALLFSTGLLAFFALFYGADTIARWIDNEQTKLAIQSVSFAFIFVPLMSTLRGYFQGRQQMLPTGVSQIVEQLVRVLTMILLLIIFTQAGKTPSTIAAGAMFGSVTGALAGLLVMLYYSYKHRNVQRNARSERSTTSSERTSRLMLRLFMFAVPVCLGAIVVPMLNIVDTFTVPRMLKWTGQSESEALVQFGIYSRGLPLVQLVAMLFSSVSVAFVPAFASAYARRDAAWIRDHAELLVRLSWLIGLASTAGLVAIAYPINVMLYKNGLGTTTMMIVSLTAVFSVINIVTSAILQGIGRPYIPALNLFGAAILKVGLNCWLIPIFGVNGAAIAAVCAFIAAAFLNGYVLMRHTGLRFSWETYVWKSIMSIAILLLVVFAVIQSFEFIVQTFMGGIGRLAYTFIALAAVGSGGTVYVAALFWFGQLSKEELQKFPELNRKVVPLLKRFRFIR